MRFPVLFVVVALIAACGGELRLGPEARLTCDADADCPAPMTCVEEARRCVLPGVVIDVTPPLFLSASASAARMGRSDTVTITLTFDEGIATANIAVEANAGAAVPLSPGIDGAVVTVVVDGTTLVSGPLVLTVTVANADGLSLSTRVPTGVTVDVDAPDVVVDDVAIEAAAGNPLFPGRTAAARVDSTVTVGVTWSEAVAASGATDVALTDSAGATAILTVAPFSSGARTTFAIAPADCAALADGDIAISLTVVDDVGNRAVRTLPTPLIKDTTPPPAPTFSRLRRTPFGEDTAAILTEAEGTATDAVVVLAVPAGVTVGPLVVPAHVARIVPAAADGALTLGIEIDVPAMRLVAVDAAGNLGTPASAQTTDLVASAALAASPHQLRARPVVADSLQQRGDTRVDDAFRDAAGAGVTTTSAPFWRPLTTIDTVQANGNLLMAKDPIAGGVIVVGNGETFRLRGSQLERLDVPPLVVQRGSAMATDERRGRIVLFGGAQPTETPTGIVRNDLFEWDGARWVTVLQHNPAATDRPSPRVAAGAGYVAAEGGVVFVNGCGADSFNFLGCPTPLPPEVWVWDGASFTRRCAGPACGDAPLPIRPEVIVDTDGAMVVTGGTSDSGLVALPPDPPPALKRFVDDTFVGRCAGECARAIPFDGAAHFNAAAQAPAFLGTCGTDVCLVIVRADNTTTTTTLESERTLPDHDTRLQARGFIVDGERLLLSEPAFPGNRILAATGGAFGQTFPATMSPRCGGAVAVVDDEPHVLGGCSLCPLAAAESQCTGPVNTMEAPLSALPARGTSPVSGNTVAAPGADDTTIVSWRLVGSAGSMDVRRASALSTVQTFALGTKRYVAAAVSPGANDSVVIVTALSDVDVFPPDFRILEPIQVLDLSDSTAVLASGCTSDCALNRSTGSGVAVAATRGGRAVLFGGTIGGLTSVVDATVVMDALGQGTSLDPAIKPPARQWAMAAYDPQRELTWLTGGTTAGDFVTGDGSRCGGPGSAVECNDLWTFDGERWTEVRPVDLFDVGLPAPRFRGQMGVVNGRVIVTGGSFGAPNNTRTLSDGWVLESSTLTPPTHQVSASFAAYGSDAEQTFAGLLARWCGTALDATGAAVPVTLRAFAGGSWRTMASTVDAAGCVDGELDLDGIADVVVREPGHTVLVEVVPTLTNPGRNAPRLTTTVLTLTGRYTAVP